MTLEEIWAEIEAATADTDRGYMNPRLRHEFCRRFSWAIPSREAITAIAEFVGTDQLLEVGAGKGLWAYLLQDAGVAVKPLDLERDPGDGNPWCVGEDFTPVWRVPESAMADTLKGWRGSQLMLCWPCYEDKFAVQALVAMLPEKLVYIGEDRWGCCADEKFFDELAEHYEEVTTVAIPQWSCIHDYLRLYRRKS